MEFTRLMLLAQVKSMHGSVEAAVGAPLRKIPTRIEVDPGLRCNQTTTKVRIA
jgi:hypothetical protein